MRNSILQDQISYSELTDTLNQHLLQARAVVEFMSVDHCNNDGKFSASDEIVGNMLWTAQTLLQNAIQTAGELHELNRQAYLQVQEAQQAFQSCSKAKLSRIEQQRLAQTVKGGNDE